MTTGHWIGWLYTHPRWQRICEAPTLAEASALLGKLCPVEARKENLRLALTAGGIPSWVPPKWRDR